MYNLITQNISILLNWILPIFLWSITLNGYSQKNSNPFEMLSGESQIIVQGKIMEVSCTMSEPGVFNCGYLIALDSIYKGNPRIIEGLIFDQDIMYNFDSLHSFKPLNRDVIHVTRTIVCRMLNPGKEKLPDYFKCEKNYEKGQNLVLFLKDSTIGSSCNNIKDYELTDRWINFIEPNSYLVQEIKRIQNIEKK